MVKLHINIDHVATLREARKTSEPDPVAAASLAETAGADGITVHLREDRRHIQDRDLRLLRQTVKTLLNLEMALSPEILEIALDVRPDEVCIVPEKRQEVTTEGGLDALREAARLREFIPRLREKGVLVSLFLDAEPGQIECAREVGAQFVELHTGRYANAKGGAAAQELLRLEEGAALGRKLGLRINAGHGLNFRNVQPVARIAGVEELNIGHAVIARAVLTGLPEAVREMKRLIDAAASRRMP